MPRAFKNNVGLLIGLGGVAAGVALFAIAFRLSLAWLYRTLYGYDNVVDGITNLPRVWRLLVPIAGATAAGVIARVLTVPRQNARRRDSPRRTTHHSRRRCS